MSSRQAIADLYTHHSEFPTQHNKLDFKSRKQFVKNDVYVLVAYIDLFLHGKQENRILQKYLNLNALTEGRLEFVDRALTLGQAYKVARLCKDRALITDENYLQVLQRIESAVKDSVTEEGKQLRKKTKYQILLQLIDMYKTGRVILRAFTDLYNGLMEKKHLFTLAIAQDDKKAISVKKLLDQVFEKGLKPVYRRNKIYTPINNPGNYFLSAFEVISAVTRPVAKWPLYVIGSILDVVLIIPLLFKLLAPIYKLFAGKSDTDFNWGGSWFTGLLGTVIGEWIGGYLGGAAIAAAVTAVTYPVYLTFALVRRCSEWLGGWGTREQRKVPLNDNLDESALDIALKAGIDIPRKPKQSYVNAKHFENYTTSRSYTKIYEFLEVGLNNNDPVLPIEKPSAPMRDDVELLERQLPGRYVQNNVEINPYLVPPTNAYKN